MAVVREKVREVAEKGAGDAGSYIRLSDSSLIILREQGDVCLAAAYGARSGLCPIT